MLKDKFKKKILFNIEGKFVYIFFKVWNKKLKYYFDVFIFFCFVNLM